eukprot:gnl/TRDRNA2_/TRDRNA2_177751_c0_seq1.p1 gnl/TRDRNA2_/TRDRNA2_177751_c0~~gnl/TRDRNA2_/TRDRNA2_177751_c0_seq1.p1  ORF type:complete len:358 (-),score=6.59 gnl/TRDRNA2_/TRDRNA2_177751_c0_seq1:202-1275(-)
MRKIKSWDLDNEYVVNETAKKTMASLHAKLDDKLQRNCAIKSSSESDKPHFIEYTPKVQGPEWNSGFKQRMIRVQNVPADPLEPPRTKNLKVPRGPPCSPVRIMHSPPRAVEAKEAAFWKIPPALSNWKNPKGYIIPLDKRILSDGKNLLETKINDNFSKLSEALYIAEQKARENTELRNRMIKEQLYRDIKKKDNGMKKLAMQARFKKLESINLNFDVTFDKKTSKVTNHIKSEEIEKMNDFDEIKCIKEHKEVSKSSEICVNSIKGDKSLHEIKAIEQNERAKRDVIRRERRRDRERDRRIEEAGGYGRGNSKLKRDLDRDISERVALDIANVPSLPNRVSFDHRLFDHEIFPEL